MTGLRIDKFFGFTPSDRRILIYITDLITKFRDLEIVVQVSIY